MVSAAGAANGDAIPKHTNMVWCFKRPLVR